MCQKRGNENCSRKSNISSCSHSIRSYLNFDVRLQVTSNENTSRFDQNRLETYTVRAKERNTLDRDIWSSSSSSSSSSWHHTIVTPVVVVEMAISESKSADNEDSDVADDSDIAKDTDRDYHI